MGMYIQELCGSWMEHPFWKSSFLLDEAKDLKTLRECGIHEVWIDTSRGLDVASSAPVATETEEHRKTEAALSGIGDVRLSQGRVSLDEEMDQARNIQKRARQAVMSMFREVRMGRALEVQQAASLVEEINQSVARNPGALLSLARLKNKDDYTYMHSVAVCVLMIALGRRLGLEGDMLRPLGMAGLLHDVGKMAVPDEVLNKPDRLTDQEFEVVKSHPVRGYEILAGSDLGDPLVLDVCLHHHERVDGTGYPHRLGGEHLTLFARMGAVCDVYDAITSDRCYKQGWQPAQAIRKMAEWKGGHFDDAVFQAFVKTVGIYPAGTLLKLKSGRLGVVMEQTEKSLLTPRLKVFFSSRANAHIPMEVVDLARSQDTVESVEDPARWGFDMQKIEEL